MFLVGDLDQTPFNCVRRLTYQMIVQRVSTRIKTLVFFCRFFAARRKKEVKDDEVYSWTFLPWAINRRSS